MSDRAWLAGQFEELRPRLQSVAYGMLGSRAEAEDAVQETWLRLDRNDADMIDDLRAWLTTVVGRICLDMLRARKSRREDYVGSWLPEPIIQEPESSGPAHQAELADSISLALLVVLESLTPAERLAFVLHDLFGLSFEEVGRVVERTPEAARQLASRARRRVRAAPQPDPDVARQRRVVDAFLDAARNGDFEALLAVLAPDAVLRFDFGAVHGRGPLVGAEAVAKHVLATAPRFVAFAKPVLVNGAPGVLFGPRAEPISVLAFTTADDHIQTLDLIIDLARLRQFNLQN